MDVHTDTSYNSPYHANTLYVLEVHDNTVIHINTYVRPSVFPYFFNIFHVVSLPQISLPQLIFFFPFSVVQIARSHHAVFN